MMQSIFCISNDAINDGLSAFAVHGVTHSVKAHERLVMTNSVDQHRSHYQRGLRVMSALRLSTVAVADSFFESGTTIGCNGVGSVVHDKI